MLLFVRSGRYQWIERRRTADDGSLSDPQIDEYSSARALPLVLLAFR